MPPDPVDAFGGGGCVPPTGTARAVTPVDVAVDTVPDDDEPAFPGTATSDIGATDELTVAPVEDTAPAPGDTKVVAPGDAAGVVTMPATGVATVAASATWGVIEGTTAVAGPTLGVTACDGTIVVAPDTVRVGMAAVEASDVGAMVVSGPVPGLPAARAPVASGGAVEAPGDGASAATVSVVVPTSGVAGDGTTVATVPVVVPAADPSGDIIVGTAPIDEAVPDESGDITAVATVAIGVVASHVAAAGATAAGSREGCVWLLGAEADGVVSAVVVEAAVESPNTTSDGVVAAGTTF